MKHRNFAGIVLLFFTALILTLSCQGGDNGPIAPSTEIGPLAGAQTSQTPSRNNSVMWGYWHVVADLENGTVEAIPLRGIQFAANVNTFLEPGGKPGPNLGITLDPEDSDLGTNLLAVDVSLKHPLPFDMYTGFDVRGIFIHNGLTSAKSDPSIQYGVEGNDTDAVLVNSDGWTRWWNPQEFLTPSVLGYTEGALANFFGTPTATLNGYKAFADGLGSEDDYREFVTSEYTYGDRPWFSAGSVNTRRYMIQFPIGQPLEYDYCVYASWEETDPSKYGDTYLYEPGDFPLSANCAEAFLIGCDSSGSTAYYEGPSDNGGSLNLKIEIFDWQGAFGEGKNISDEIAEIRIESLSTLIDEPDNTWIISPPDIELISDKGSDVSSVYTVDIANLNLTKSGDEELLISVLNANPNDYDSGFGAVYPGGAALSACMFTTVAIGGSSPCPTPVITDITPDAALPNSYVDNALIEGADFVYGADFSVKLVFETTEFIGTDIDNTTPTSFTADFDLTGASTEVFDVVVTNDCGTEGVGEDLFSVVYCVTPEVTAIDPSCLHAGSYVAGVEISGNDFVDGTYLAVRLFDGVNELLIEKPLVAWENGGLVTCDIDLGTLPAGDYDVEVIQGCNPLLSGMLENGLTIHSENTGVPPYIEVGYDSTYDLRNHPGAIEVFLADDDSSGTIAFFNFDYYGVTYEYFDIDSNGGVMLKQSATDTTYASDIFGECGEDSPYVIPFGEDLDTNDGVDGHVYYEIQGSAPNRTLTVHWVEAQCYPGGNQPGVGSHTFSVTFLETSNLIRFQYEHPDIYNTGSSSFGEPPIALCNFEIEDFYYPEQSELFCALDEWPDSCINFRAYEVDLPDATMIPPPACTFNYSEQAYDTGYECTPGAYVIQISDLTPTMGTLSAWDEGVTDPIDLGFTFSYRGIDYTSVVIDVNGSVTFGTEPEEVAELGLACNEDPTHDIVSAQDDDLDNENGGDIPIGEIKYETRMVGSSQCFIAEWEGVPSWLYPTTSSNTFQIVLIDGSDTICDDVIFQWNELYDSTCDTVMQYDFVTYCLYTGGGQTVPGGVFVYPE